MFFLLVDARRSAVASKELSDGLLDLPEDFGPRVFDSLFTLTDPMPFVAVFWTTVKYFFSYSIGALVGRLGRRR
jgi:hypothetical protein